MPIVFTFLVATLISGHVAAFDKASYLKTDIDKYSKEKTEEVKKARKDGATSESLGFSFNKTPGQKIQVETEFVNCAELSLGNSNFLNVGSNIGAINPNIKDLASRECELKVNGKNHIFFAQTEVADWLKAKAKTETKIVGTAYLLYLGVSNESAKFLLNKFATVSGSNEP